LFSLTIVSEQAQGWQLRDGDAQQARAQLQAMEDVMTGSRARTKKLNEKLRVAKWKFSCSVVRNMYHRMLRKVRERMVELGHPVA
jgi:hypothetical protein